MAASKFSLVLLVFLAFGFKVSSQEAIPFLEKKITLNINSKSVYDILKSIEKQGGFTFSYDARLIVDQKPQSIKAVNKSIREVLDMVFNGTVIYSEKGNHIILKRAEYKRTSDSLSYFIISGYIIDALSNEQIFDASIYDKKSRASTISDRFGYFKLRINNRQKEQLLSLSVSKDSYKDTVIIIKQSGNTILNIGIYQEENLAVVDSAAIRDSLYTVNQLALINLILSEEAQSNTKNISDTLYNDFQISFLPFLGTNYKLSGNTVNDYSLNILAGYSMGTRKLEVGGLVNVVRDSVKNVQLAGLANVTGGPVSGVQAAGLVNVNLKHVKGVQLAGLINNNLDSTSSTQFSGLMNVNLKQTTGVLVAGLMNVNTSTVKSPQVAGLLNVGIDKVKGAQVAGLLNVAVREISGVQVAGLINYARKVHGSQVGFLNISDSISGVPVGFMSLVKSGYHQLEISVDEVFPLSTSFRTGVNSFYNIFSAGFKSLGEPDNIWYFGYGLGSSVDFGKQWKMNFDLVVNQPMAGNRLNEFNPLTKFNLTAEKRFSKYISVAAGPVFNYFLANTTDPDYNDVYSKLPPGNVISTNVISSNESDDYVGSFWIGGKVALRLF